MSNATRTVRRSIARDEELAARLPREGSTLYAGTREDGSRFYHLGHDERPVRLPYTSPFRPRSYTPPEYRAVRDERRAKALDFAPSYLPVHFHGSPTPNPGRLNLRSTAERVAAAEIAAP